MDIFVGLIIGPLLIIYGYFVYNGKLLWFLINYKIRFKDETDEKHKRKVYRIYGLIFIIIGIIVFLICCVFYINGISVPKDNNLY